MFSIQSQYINLPEIGHVILCPPRLEVKNSL